MKKINIRGVIVPNGSARLYKFYGYDATEPAMVLKDLADAQGGDVEILINSEGGEVQSGKEIYTALKSYSGNVRIVVQSLAASAAAVIAMAGHVVMAPVAQIMIHNVSSYVAGDTRDMAHMADVLQSANKALAAAFMAKTGKSEQEILDLMAKETWLTAKEAVENGFADEILTEETGKSQSIGKGTQLAASCWPALLPQNVLDYARDCLAAKEKKANAAFELLKLEERKI